jgi:hypothetical protein
VKILNELKVLIAKKKAEKEAKEKEKAEKKEKAKAAGKKV